MSGTRAKSVAELIRGTLGAALQAYEYLGRRENAMPATGASGSSVISGEAPAGSDASCLKETTVSTRFRYRAIVLIAEVECDTKAIFQSMLLLA